MNEIPEQELLRIFLQYQPYIRSIFSCFDEDTINDLTQEVFLQGLIRYKEARNLRNWLLGIAHNLRRVEFRRRLKSFDQAIGSYPDPFDILAKQEEIDMMLQRINRLPDKYRRALKERYLEGKSYAEIGAGLSVKQSTARSLVCRALKKVRIA